MLTFIDGSPLKAGPLSRGSTVFGLSLSIFAEIWHQKTHLPRLIAPKWLGGEKWDWSHLKDLFK